MKFPKLLLFTFIILCSCNDKEQVTPDEKVDDDPITKPEKKGIGMTLKQAQWSHKISEAQVYWHYTWGSTRSEYEPDSVEFVPMIWGAGGIDEAKIADLKALKNKGKIKYLLGFNEPDGANQANMTVDEAINKWPLLEAVGVPLGSPACVHADGDWMQEFMSKATDQALRIDFVGVHWYGGTNPAAFLNKLESIYNLYKKPIWITEFGCGDWSAETADENRHTPEAVLQFMKEVLPELEKREYIQRYAWFPADVNKPALATSALWDADGNLTALGNYYANFSPNTSIGEGKQPAIDPLMVFEDDFENYSDNADLKNHGYVIWEGGAKAISGEAFEGMNYGQSDASKQNFAIRRSFTLEAGKTYQLKVATKMQDGAKHIIQIHPNNAYESAWKECLNADWQLHTTQFTVTGGNENVTISLYRWPLKVLSFDNIVLREVQ